MKKELLIIIIFFFLIFGFSGEGLLGQTPPKGWKGEITEVNGVKIIKNPAEPLYGEITLELEKELEFGNDEDDNYYFYITIRLAVDSLGNFFILDAKEIRLHKFGPDGKFIRAIGRKGQGPGEFERPHSICFDIQDNLYVQESNRVNIFSNEGDNLATITSRQSLEMIVPFNPNTLLAVHFQFNPKGPLRQIVLINGSGEVLKDFAVYQDNIPTIIKGRNRIFVGYHQYKYKLFTADFHPGRVIYACSSDYQLHVIDKTKGIVAEIRVDEPPLPLTSEDKNKVVKSFIANYKKRGVKVSHSEAMRAHNFPEHKPFFQLILSDRQGLLFVLRKLPMKEELCTFDLFNSDGIFIHRIHTPSFPVSIKNGFFYQPRHDREKEFWVIQRFKIINWSKIKRSSSLN